RPRATVLFSHDCLAPSITATDGTRRLCPRFGGCLTCPGLVIPIDADHLARVLIAIDRLDQAKHRLDPRRWEMLYAPSYRAITQDILPDFPDTLRAEALALAAMMPPLPELEWPMPARASATHEASAPVKISSRSHWA